MNRRFYLLIFFIVAFLPMGILRGDFQFSLENYLMDDDPYPECLKEGKNGNIYVSDRQSYFIRVFSPEGKYLYSFGGKGEGPGKFKSWFGNYDIGPGGEIGQVDFINGNRRITLFTPEGKLIESVSIKDPMKTGGMYIFIRNDGNFIVLLTGSVIMEKHGSLFYLGASNSFSIVDRKGILKETLHEDKTFYSFSDRPNERWPSIPYHNLILSAYSPSRDTLAFQKMADDRVTIIDLRNKKTLRIPNGFKLSPLTKQDIDIWVEDQKSENPHYNYNDLIPYFKKFRANGIGFNPYKPIIDRIFFNTEGELFISYYDKKKKKYTINKFSSDNKQLGMKVLDRIPAFIGKERVYYLIYHDEEETHTVEVKTSDDFFKNNAAQKKK